LYRKRNGRLWERFQKAAKTERFYDSSLPNKTMPPRPFGCGGMSGDRDGRQPSLLRTVLLEPIPVREALCSVTARPIVDLPLGLLLGEAVTLLDLAGKLDTAALDDIEIVIREFAPLCLGLALVLGPLAFDDIPVHVAVLSIPLNAMALLWKKRATAEKFRAI
jgi:hypothetical protein